MYDIDSTPPSLGGASATGLEKLLPKAIVEKRRRRKLRRQLGQELDESFTDGDTESMGSSDNRRSWMSTASNDGQVQWQQHEQQGQGVIPDSSSDASRPVDATAMAPEDDGAASIDS